MPPDPDPPPAPPPSSASFESLLEKHLPSLQAFVRLRAGAELLRHESSSDLAQSVCREVLQHRDRFAHGGDAAFRSWLYTTASRKIMNRHAYYRANRRDVGRNAPGGYPVARDEALLAACRRLSTPSRRLAAKEEVARIEGVLDALPDDRREVILLSRIAGLSHKEIADHLGRTESACRVLLHRALADLAERLFTLDGPDGGAAP